MPRSLVNFLSFSISTLILVNSFLVSLNSMPQTLPGVSISLIKKSFYGLFLRVPVTIKDFLAWFLLMTLCYWLVSLPYISLNFSRRLLFWKRNELGVRGKTLIFRFDLLIEVLRGIESLNHVLLRIIGMVALVLKNSRFRNIGLKHIGFTSLIMLRKKHLLTMVVSGFVFTRILSLELSLWLFYILIQCPIWVSTYLTIVCLILLYLCIFSFFDRSSPISLVSLSWSFLKHGNLLIK